MSQRITLSLAAVFALFGPLAQAQSLPFAVETEGRLSLGYSDRTAGADAFLVGDATLRLDFSGLSSGLGSGLPLGLEIGLYGRADALDTPHETYGALTWDLPGGGRFLVGVPRPAYDSFAVSALEHHFPSLGVDRATLTRSEATSGAMFANYLPFGLRFQNETAGLRYAMSVHRADNMDRTIASLGMSREFGDWTIEGAIEAGFGASTDVGGKMQLHGTVGAVSGGIGYYAPGARPGPDLLEAFASFDPIDRLTLSGVVQVPLDSTLDPTIGLSAHYAVRDDVSLALGVVSDAGADATVTAFLDWTF
jgi:hypothetical protein